MKSGGPGNACKQNKRSGSREAGAGRGVRTGAGLYQEITDRIIAELERGIVPWVKPWGRAKAGLGLPKNAATGRLYSGINILILWGAVFERSYASQNWLTFHHQHAYSDDGACTNQAESFFSRLRRAEIGTHHQISGRYLRAYASEISWREDNRRESNGEQYLAVANASLNHPVSCLWAAIGSGRRADVQISSNCNSSSMAGAAISNPSGRLQMTGSAANSSRRLSKLGRPKTFEKASSTAILTGSSAMLGMVLRSIEANFRTNWPVASVVARKEPSRPKSVGFR